MLSSIRMKNIITRIYVNADMKISLSLNDYILLLDSDPSTPKESQSDFTVHSMVRAVDLVCSCAGHARRVEELPRSNAAGRLDARHLSTQKLQTSSVRGCGASDSTC